jgi:hypothetical protein
MYVLFSALVSYQLTKPGPECSVQSLIAEFCGLSVEETAEEEEERSDLLRESFAHRLTAYSQAHAIFRSWYSSPQQSLSNKLNKHDYLPLVLLTVPVGRWIFFCISPTYLFSNKIFAQLTSKNVFF